MRGAAALVGGGLWLLSACGGEPAPATPSRPPPILFLMWDTVRADHLGVYGYDRDTTPNLDRRAAEALVFERAVAPSCWTAPSHASLFTGWPAVAHGAIGEQPFLSPRFDTLAEILGEAGYATWMFSSNPYVSAPLRMTQGFQTVVSSWEEPVRAEVLARARTRGVEPAGEGFAWTVTKEAGPVGVEALSGWLQQVPEDQPWFAFLGLMEAHWPWHLTPEEQRWFLDEAEVRAAAALDQDLASLYAYNFGHDLYSEQDLALMAALYDSCIRRLDAITEDLFQVLEEHGPEDLVVVLVADHGDAYGEHHLVGHEYALYDELTRVPLMMWGAGRTGRVTTPVSLLDLPATLLALAGVPERAPPGRRDLRASTAETAQGAPLVSEFLAPKTGFFGLVEPRYPVADKERFLAPLRSVERDGWKLILRGREPAELYHVATDPGEQVDRLAEQPERAARLQSWLEEWSRRECERVPPPTGEGREGTLDPRHRRLLEALGYAIDGG